MKCFAGTMLLIALTQVSNAQFYYKDLVAAREGSDKWRLYKDNHVRSVRLSSYERDGKPAEGFVGDQEVSGDGKRLVTHTKAVQMAESWITAVYSPEGLTLKIVDSSDTYRSVSDYQYDTQGRLASITNTSIETDNHMKDVEQHIWQYEPAHPDRPSGMLKIKNGNDTTFVRIVADEKGNVAEERAVRNKASLPAIYYYYDADNHLTDIVRYNLKASRLLPDNIFEYGDGGRLASMVVVPESSNNYLKWLYEYNEKGLKAKESCFSKQKELLGWIEYQYSYK